MMTRTRNIITCTMALLAAMSCSDVGEEERFVDEGIMQAQRSILLEDFTGQRCVNCPSAMKEIEKLQALYGDSLVAVGIYGGPFAKTVGGKRYPLTNDIGEHYADQRKIEEQPFGYVNRVKSTSNYNLWAQMVSEQITQKTPIAITLSNDYDEAGRQLTIGVKAYSSQDIADARLQVWITEDGITSRQETESGNDNNFVHNHVLRASVTDWDGDPVELGEGKRLDKQYTITLDEGWNAGNLDVVAFIFTPAGVQQAKKADALPTHANGKPSE